MRGLRDLGVRCLALLLCLAPLAAAAALPDTPRPRQFTVADGLPSNRINALVEDRHGYLWIATSDGLARYDGTGFRIWREEQGLPDNFVWTLALDADGRLWIGTAYGGLAVYEPERDRFRYINRANTPELGSDEIWSLEVTPDGAVWIGTANAGLHRLAPDGRMTRYMPRQGDDRSLPHDSVVAIAAARGALWIGTTDAVARWTGSGFERLPIDRVVAGGRVNHLHLDDDGTLWIGTTAGVAVRHADGRLSPAPWRSADPELRILQVLLHDSRGDCWLDVPKGLGHVSAGRVSNVPLYSEAAQGLVRPQWTAAHEDREGGVWLVSNSHGLWYQPAHWSQFAVLGRRLDDPDTLANAHVRAIAAASDGGMWLVGSGGVLDWFDPDSGEIRHVMSDIGEGMILDGVHEDRHGAVWVGWRGGLARIEPGNRRIRRWSRNDQVDATRGESRFFAETGDGLLWLASETGTVQARDADGRIRREYLPGDGSGLEQGEAIRHMRLGPDGAPWLATTLGLKRLLPEAGRWAPVPGAGSAVRSDLAVLGAERVWLSGVGTLQRCRWNGQALTCEPGLGPEDGLPRLMFGGMAVDAAGIAWLTSVRGLVRVDPEARTVRVYSAWDGLPGQEFARPPVARPADGRILAATPDGLVVFDPARVAVSGQVPRLVIERVDVRGRGRDEPTRFAPERPFAIGHDDRDLRVVARLLSFRNTAANVYAFRLEGHDEDWVETAAAGERIFSQLAPGRYALQVRARNADNVWSRTHELSFEVRPPWWKTSWALALFVAAGLLLAWWAAAAYRTRLRRRSAWQLVQHKRELAEQASEAKTRFLATLGHEVRTPMTGVLGMSELLLETPLDGRQRGYTESIRRAGEHLMRLVNDALDLARIEAGKLQLDPQPFDLRGLLDDVSGLMAPLAQQRGLAYREQVARGVPQWVRGDAGRVRQILLNLLGNAIKFTEQGQVGLRVEPGEGLVRFVVSDTGPGLNAEQKQRLFRRFEQAEGARTAARYGGSGLGLAICQELAAAMDGRIEVDSAPGEGTRFTVELPLPPATARAATAPEATCAPEGCELLLVEDHPTVAEVIAGLLRTQGHRVTVVGHGLAALAEVAAGDFDLALLDLDLPGIDGLALARQLRSQGFERPLVAVTARADADAEPLARAAGFDAFLRKPVTGEALAATIRAMLDLRGRREPSDWSAT
ncbi:two-component regulator propeller domain-containing protein [Luteimonas sp. R10]|uniref:hybrid sensor histidine kinase/response regulator n=1 Tax=Luteimonas sp. R10 TaxID=3108176 RepID=UPI003085B536|nr:two-component regulator propeller domain-containing protein [Luteimonas sp. R10]